MANGVDAAKALAIGANLVSFGRALLESALHSTEQLGQLFERVEFELKAAMFGIGAANLQQLTETNRLIKHR
jgi:isopentenyl-diphosphate delta-isomerase